MHGQETLLTILVVGVLALTAAGAALAAAKKDAPAPAATKTDAAKKDAPAAAPVLSPELLKNREAAEKMGWRLATQAYSFNSFTFAEACQKTASVGCKYIEAFPGQKLSKEKGFSIIENMSDAEIAETKAVAAANGLTIVNYGVTGIPGDEAGARKMFEFAKKLGLETFVTEANEKDFPLLDKLTAEYKINIALHNHPKPSHYWNPDIILKGIAGHSDRIGSCSDTGHWARSGLNPLECLKKLEGHIISLHFKDLNKMAGDGHDVPWGTGACDAKAMLAELKRQNFKGVFSIEYEYNMKNSVPEIAKCVEFFYATAAELAKSPAGK